MAQLQRLAIAPAQFQHPLILLTGEQQHYLGRVLRLRQGDRFIALDGQQWWLAELTETTEAKILQSIEAQNELPVAVTLVTALPKGNAFDEVIRQATELGVACFAPVISDRTLLHPSPQKLERWRRIAQEAAEQSERQVVPTVLDPIPFANSLPELISADVASHRYFCVARGSAPHLADCLSREALQSTPAIVIAIGPEGGWTTAEVQAAIAAGYQSVSLGSRILRAVTAPLVALSLIAAALESKE